MFHTVCIVPLFAKKHHKNSSDLPFPQQQLTTPDEICVIVALDMQPNYFKWVSHATVKLKFATKLVGFSSASSAVI